MANFPSDDFSISDPADGSKILNFDVSGYTSGTGFQRAVTLPDTPGYMVLSDDEGSSGHILFSAGGAGLPAFWDAPDFYDNAFRISDSADTAKKLAWEVSAITSPATRTMTVLNLSGAPVVVGDDAPAVASGSLGKVDSTAQVADVTTTNLSNTPPAGVYEVEVYLLCTTADVTAGTLTVTLGWTDGVGATTSTPITAFTLASTGRTSGRQLMQVASGNITYAVAITGGYGTSQYEIYVRTVALG